MKLLVCSFFSILVLLGSCSPDSSVVSPAGSEAVSSEGTIVERVTITPTTTFPFMTNYDKAEAQKKTTNGKARVAAHYGPFTVNGNLIQMYPNRKTLLTSNQSIYPVAQYFCDIWKCEYKFTLPAGSTVSLDGASQFGYDNFSEQTIGVELTQSLKPSGKEYTIYTWSIVPNTDLSGRYIYNGTIPVDLTGTTFTYSYNL